MARMAAPIDRDSPVAIYRQAADDVRRRIEAGEWQPGQRVSGVADLMTEYGIARLTMRKAMRVLADEGVVEVSTGKGYYVAGTPG